MSNETYILSIQYFGGRYFPKNHFPIVRIVHNLTGKPVNSTSSIGKAKLGQTHTLIAINIEAESNISKPSNYAPRFDGELANAYSMAHVNVSGNTLETALEDVTLNSSVSILTTGYAHGMFDRITAEISTSVIASGALNKKLDDLSSLLFGDVFTGIDSPYEDVISWTGHPLTGSRVRVRTGNLFGIFGHNNEFGIYAGEGWDARTKLPPSPQSKYIRIGNFVNEFHNIPVNLYDGTNVTLQLSPNAPSFAMGNPLPSGYDSGTGLWQGKDTDGIYKWRVGDPSSTGSSLNWDGDSLILRNSSFEVGGPNAHLAFGNPPPLSKDTGTGIWIDRTGFYGIYNNQRQVFIDTINGAFYAGDVRLDRYGLTVGSQLVINRALESDVDVELAFWRTTGGDASIFWNGDIMWTTRIFRPEDLIVKRISATEPSNTYAGMVWVQP